MRAKAFILIFPFLVFLIETASFIPAMNDACIISVPEESSCCMKTKKEGECNSKKDDNKKAPEEDCTNKPDCTTCPVCYTFIFQQQYEWSAAKFIFKKDYSLMNNSYSSTYIPSVWKPPNGFDFYS